MPMGDTNATPMPLNPSLFASFASGSVAALPEDPQEFDTHIRKMFCLMAAVSRSDKVANGSIQKQRLAGQYAAFSGTGS